MELKWLEDFVSLAETRSFSRSAELRHITQPAFSRRIQALEAWLGTELIDRSVYPTRLTQAGQVFYEQALAMLSQFHEARTLLRGQTATPHATIEFAVPHTLSLTYFPRWLQRIEARLGRDPHASARAERARCGVVAGGRRLRPGDGLSPSEPSGRARSRPLRHADARHRADQSVLGAVSKGGRARYTLPGTAERPRRICPTRRTRTSAA